MDEWNEIKKENYEKKVVLMSEWGAICFDPEDFKRVVGGEHLSYDEYLEIQKETLKDARHYFDMCYHTIPTSFKGRIEKFKKEKVCFNRIYIEGMYPDGECFEGKEEHVWMDSTGFEEYQIGDSLSFIAEVYQYIKKGNGKAIDFGLRNPQDIKKIPDYELPTDEQLRMQAIEQMVCESCNFHEFCYGDCMLPKGARAKRIKAIKELVM